MTPLATGTFRTIAEAVRVHAEVAPNTTAISAPGRTSMTFRELDAGIARTGADLNALGIGRGDVVAVMLPNGPEMAAAFLTIGSNATCAPLNPAFRLEDVEASLARLGAQALLVSRAAAEALAPVARARNVRLLQLTPDVGSCAGAFEFAGEPGGGPARTGPAQAEDVALILHTSGTSSKPKKVALTHANIGASALNIIQSLQLTARDRRLNVMPLFHVQGLVGGVYSCLAAGGSIICAPSFEPHRFFEWLEEFSPTWYSAVPGMHRLIMAEASRYASVVERQRLRFVRVGSYGLSRPDHERLEAVFQAPAIEAYGMTEAASQISVNPLPPGRRKLGTVGLVAGPEVAILDDRGDMVRPGAVGEIVIRGPNVITAYLDDPDVNRGAFTNGWLRTGDLGRFDEDGYLVLAGRTKEIINRGGEKISPREIDQALEAHPAVEQAMAFAIPDSPMVGEEIGAAVVLRKASVLSAAQLGRHARALLPSFKVPRRFVFLDELPKGATGKVSRLELAAALRDRLEAHEARSDDVRSDLVAELREHDPDHRLASLVAMLETDAAATLLLDASELSSKRPLWEFGLDSLRAVEYRNRVAARFAPLEISPTLVFDHPTLAQQAQFILSELNLADRKPVRVRPRSTDEPIAIIGMSCRFPGGANDPDAYWRLLSEGRDAITEVPRDRWDIDAYYDPDPSAPGKICTRHGGFLDGIDRFEPDFFGISQREARTLDPQQRLLLELAWEAFEDAGLRPRDLFGGRTGVFVGVYSADYAIRALQPDHLDMYAVTGNAHSVAAGRISYVLGLRGPSLAIDTACSSSLVAVHLACESLRRGECDAALVGAINLMLSPEKSLVFTKMGVYAPDGRCKTFDARANGFVRSEGAGGVVLKRLCEASAANDRILAVIRGSAINHDGRSSGLTAPSGPSQEDVIQCSLDQASLEPSDLDYVECHGTGTLLGDPIEVRALARVLGGPTRTRPLLLGSAKSNIGHAAAAAGMAGLIKVVLSLVHEELPPSLHFRVPNPHIPWSTLPVGVVTERLPWKRGCKRRLAGVSAFGFGGTNAHVILEEAPATAVPVAAVERPMHAFVLSARSPAALDSQVAQHAEFLASHGELSLADACYTAATARTHFDHRLGLVAATPEKLLADLEALALGESPRTSVRRRLRAAARPRIAFLFAGQGSQYVGMGRTLFETQPVFRDTMERCAKILDTELPRPLLDVIYPRDEAPSPIDETGFSQPALFALEYALAGLWRSWGIVPDAVMGHSLGEYVAACVAGVFSLEDGLRLIAARARLMQSLPPGGAMLSVWATEERVRRVQAPYEASVSIAALNARNQTVIAGEQRDVLAIGEALAREGLKTKRLTVSHAFHSPLMRPIVDEFERIARSVVYASPRIPLVGNVDGRAVMEEVRDPAYWARQILAPVRFAAGVGALDAMEIDAFIEISPTPSLIPVAQACLPETEAAWLPSLRKNHEDWATLLGSLVELHVGGVDVDWKGFDAPYARRRVALPTYPFQRQRFWIEQQTERRLEGLRVHPLLGVRLSLAGEVVVFEGRLSTDEFPFLKDHLVYGKVVVPGMALLEMGRASAQAVRGEAHVEDLVLLRALVLDEGGRIVQVHVGTDGAFTIYSRGEQVAGAGEFALHATGRISPDTADSKAAREKVDLDAIRRCCTERVSLDDAFYATIEAGGTSFGPSFRGLTELWRGEGEALARLRTPHVLAESAADYPVHPALLDTALRPLLRVACNVTSAVFLPFEIERFICRPAAGDFWVHARADEPVSPEVCSGEVTLIDVDGTTIGSMRVRFKRAEVASMEGASKTGDATGLRMFEVVWTEAPPARGASLLEARWLVVGEGGGKGELARQLSQRLGSKDGVLGRDSHEIGRALAQAEKAGHPVRGLICFEDEEHLGPSPSAEALRRSVAALDLVNTLGARTLRLVWVTRGGRAVRSVDARDLALSASPLVGLLRVVRNERSTLDTTLVDLDPAATDRARELDALLAELQPQGDAEVAYRDDQRLVPRLVPAASSTRAELVVPDAPSYRLSTGEGGTFEDLRLEPQDRRPAGQGEVEIEIEASGVTFRDVLNALAEIPGGRRPFGGECCGRITAVGRGVSGFSPGDPVLAVLMASDREGFSRYVTVDARYVVPKPASLAASQAAALPVAFLTASYGLFYVGRLRKGERVLIHSAASGVGLAAVQLALRAGAEVFATASPSKWSLLESMGVRHVESSRTLDFAERFRKAAGGQGIDVVLNSLTGEHVGRSLALLAPGGRFLEMGKRDVRDPTAVAERFPGVTYLPFDAALDAGPERTQALLSEIIAAMDAGELQPLPVTTFPIARAPLALRLMAQGKHVGKLVFLPAARAAAVREDATYLVTGGLGALGRHVARWLATKGARHIVLVGRREPDAEARAAIDALEALGAEVTVATADVRRRDQLEGVLEAIPDTTPLRGVVHLAGTLDTGLLREQTAERFRAVMAPKVEGAWNLHELTRDRPLDFFLLFSSMAVALGTVGQSNYAAANSFLDALAEQRHAEGLAALSLGWGPWSGEGMITRVDASTRQRLERRALRPGENLALLERALEHGHPLLGAFRLDRASLDELFPGGIPLLFSQVIPTPPRPNTHARADLAEQLAKLKPVGRLAHLQEELRAEASKILGLVTPKALPVHRPLGEFGLDSLMAVELRAAYSKRIARSLSATLAFDYPTITDQAHFLLEVLGLAHDAEEAPAEESPSTTGLSDMSDDELIARLEKRSVRQPGRSR